VKSHWTPETTVEGSTCSVGGRGRPRGPSPAAAADDYDDVDIYEY